MLLSGVAFALPAVAMIANPLDISSTPINATKADRLRLRFFVVISESSEWLWA